MADKIKDILNGLNPDDPLYEKVKEQDRQRSLYGDSIKEELRNLINHAKHSSTDDPRYHAQLILEYIQELVNACVALAHTTNEKHVDAFDGIPNVFNDPKFRR